MRATNSVAECMCVLATCGWKKQRDGQERAVPHLFAQLRLLHLFARLCWLLCRVLLCIGWSGAVPGEVCSPGQLVSSIVSRCSHATRLLGCHLALVWLLAGVSEWRGALRHVESGKSTNTNCNFAQPMCGTVGQVHTGALCGGQPRASSAAPQLCLQTHTGAASKQQCRASGALRVLTRHGACQAAGHGADRCDTSVLVLTQNRWCCVFPWQHGCEWECNFSKQAYCTGSYVACHTWGGPPTIHRGQLCCYCQCESLRLLRLQ